MTANLIDSAEENIELGSQTELIYDLNANPPVLQKILVALQHVLAIFVSVVTAPLIISQSINLSAVDTSYMISSSLIVSGIATFIQVKRIHFLGSGLLSIQGTSFSFISPIAFAVGILSSTHSHEDMMGVIFGSAAAGAVVVMFLSFFLHRLKQIITPTVAAVAVVLIGINLVYKTLVNLSKEMAKANTNNESSIAIVVMVVLVIVGILWLSTRRSNWCRLGSVSIAISVGYIVAGLAGLIDFSLMKELPNYVFLQPLKFSLGFDWVIFFAFLPIYLVMTAESVGDITATSSLSKLPISGDSYWKRVKGGVLADGFNSVLAAFFSTFPNTTFSQNNGVIQLTKVASRHIGFWIAGVLIILGCIPWLGGLFQVMPKGLLFGSTGLMFAMVVWSGLKIIKIDGGHARSWLILSLSIVAALILTKVPDILPNLNATVIMLLKFPVAGGTITAVILEIILPKNNANQSSASYARK